MKELWRQVWDELTGSAAIKRSRSYQDLQLRVHVLEIAMSDVLDRFHVERPASLAEMESFLSYVDSRLKSAMGDRYEEFTQRDR